MPVPLPSGASRVSRAPATPPSCQSSGSRYPLRSGLRTARSLTAPKSLWKLRGASLAYRAPGTRLALLIKGASAADGNLHSVDQSFDPQPGLGDRAVDLVLACVRYLTDTVGLLARVHRPTLRSTMLRSLGALAFTALFCVLTVGLERSCLAFLATGARLVGRPTA
ncbi:hypothetical protein ACKKBF_B17650 [Auxenochlorella protothecoides x Auxenochlorella symbiontica]